MDSMDSGAGESGTLTGARLHSAVLLQGFVEFSEVSHCQLCEWFRSQAGLHVVFHIPAIVFQRARPESDRHLLQPCVQPFPESHFALLRQVNALVGVDILAELCSQLFLIISVDVAEDRVAVFLVSYHDAALPATVVPLAHHAVAGRSALCHLLFTSSPNITVVFVHALGH